MYTFRPLSPLAKLLLEAYAKKPQVSTDEKRITVNPIVSKFASWYERVRNAMEIREEEVILRATIERILKRRLLLGGNGKTTALPLIKELLWARYLPDQEVGESVIRKVEESINLHLALRLKVLAYHRFSESIINEWTYDLMSSDVQYLLNPNKRKELMANFMFHILKDDVRIDDEKPETRDAQVFMAVRKAFSKDDLAFLRYQLFSQYFGKLTVETLEYTAKHFPEGYKELLRQIEYPARDRIYSYVKKRTAAFFILEDVLNSNKENLKSVLEGEEALRQEVFDACKVRYQGVAVRVRSAVIRSVFFILLTKVAFAFGVEGTYEKLVYGHIIWPSIIINTCIPPLLMVIVSLFIRTPGADNSKRILAYINELLYAEDPQMGSRLLVSLKKQTNDTFTIVFNVLWLLAFILSFGGIIFVLTKLHFNIVSQSVFIFFLAIVSFLSYRISLLANVYKVGDREGFLTLVVDFLFMPVIRVGRRLTQTVSKINFFIFIFDFFIEAPFKSLFAFFDQWFYFLRGKSEELE